MTRVQRIRHYEKIAEDASARAFRLRAKACPDCKALAAWPDSVLIEENGQMVHYHRGLDKNHPAGSQTLCLAYVDRPIAPRPRGTPTAG